MARPFGSSLLRGGAEWALCAVVQRHESVTIALDALPKRHGGSPDLVWQLVPSAEDGEDTGCQVGVLRPETLVSRQDADKEVAWIEVSFCQRFALNDLDRDGEQERYPDVLADHDA